MPPFTGSFQSVDVVLLAPTPNLMVPLIGPLVLFRFCVVGLFVSTTRLVERRVRHLRVSDMFLYRPYLARRCRTLAPLAKTERSSGDAPSQVEV